MTRRQLLAALTGCAVAKPVMLNPRRADNWFFVPEAPTVFFISHKGLMSSTGLKMTLISYDLPHL